MFFINFNIFDVINIYNYIFLFLSLNVIDYYLFLSQIKISGVLCLVCAVLCVIVTVTTTVLHMNRLQTLQECEFFPHSKSCTCTPYTGVLDPHMDGKYLFIVKYLDFKIVLVINVLNMPYLVHLFLA